MDLEKSEVRFRGRTHPFQVISSGPDGAELEIGGERVRVGGWPAGLAKPPGAIAVLGEAYEVREIRIQRSGAMNRGPAPAAARSPGPLATESASPSDSSREGIPVFPPMPGKVVEVRVGEGDRVQAGQVLLVLEAMKMRNEVSSPAAGKVAELQVRVGSNVRAREPMARILPK